MLQWTAQTIKDEFDNGAIILFNFILSLFLLLNSKSNTTDVNSKKGDVYDVRKG